MSVKTFITAHSGCEGTPDNSMEHVRAAVASGAEILEIDVRSRDGVLYLWHDEKADPFGDGCVLFSDFLDELKKTPAVRVNCDMKTDGLAAAVMEEAAKLPRQLHRGGEDLQRARRGVLARDLGAGGIRARPCRLPRKRHEGDESPL